MSELWGAMRTLGFKAKRASSISSLLVTILLLGNVQFRDGDFHDVSAYIFSAEVLKQAARLLGAAPDDLSQILANKTNYVLKELYTVLLNAEQCACQRDHFVRDLYAILSAFVAETANDRIAPSPKDHPAHTQIALLDQPGLQGKGPAGGSLSSIGTTTLASPFGQNGFDELCIDFAGGLLQSYVQ